MFERHDLPETQQKMYPRPLHFNRNRSALLSDQARRASVRQLFFEVLENRTLLTADLSIVELRLDTISGLEAATTMTTASIPATDTIASGLHMELVNTTSPNAPEPNVDDRLLLRLSLSDSVAHNLIGVASQVRVTFDSEVVAVDSTSAQPDENSSADQANSSPQNYVLQRFDNEVQSSDALLLEFPFRVIAERNTVFSARLVTSSNIAGFVFLGSKLSVDFPVTIVSGPIDQRSNYSGGGFYRDSEPDGTIKIEPRSIPTTSPFRSEPDSDPFSSIQKTFDEEPTRAFKSLGEADLLGPSNASPARSSWSLSSDAMWNRHRTILILDGERGLVSRRSADKISDLFLSRLLNQERSKSKAMRSADWRLDLLHSEKPGRTSPRMLSIDRMFFAGGTSQYEDEDSQPSGVVILSPEECDAVLSQWMAKAPSSKPRPK